MPSRDRIDVAVIGAGIAGLAVAARLSRAGREVVVLERHAGIARESSSRNSQVVHAGIYYPTGSAKARLCVEGRERIEARCRQLRIPYRRIGKWIVARDETELPELERLRALGTANGVPGLEFVSARERRAAEPALRVRAALRSPATGIVDAHALCTSFLAEAEAHGAVLLLRHECRAIERDREGYLVSVGDPSDRDTGLACAAVVNAAGLRADRVAGLAGIDVDAAGYRIHPCKGDYFALRPGSPLALDRLVYPLPDVAGLGVHASLDLAGRIRFGPDATWLRGDPDAPGAYHVDADRASAFAEALRGFVPALRTEWLTPDGSGIRPKLAGPGEPPRDFVVAEESARGLPGFVNLIGIESPGLTAAPALAEEVARLLAW